MCIRALQMDSNNEKTKATICKTISCLLPTDLEVKRACQLTEFLLEPTVDAYYAVETLYNEPDQKLDDETMPVPNSLRCELLLVFKTQWPFDPEFWDWKTLKRQCLALMGEEASIVSSIDILNDSDSGGAPEEDEEPMPCQEQIKDVTDCFFDSTNELGEITDKRQKNKTIKTLREKGFISARFRNWQAYMQYCVLCDKEFLGHRIVRHAHTHFKDGLYSCPICAETFTSKDTLVPHVALHVKQSCKERLSAMKTNKKLADPKTAAPVIAELKAKTEHNLHKKENRDYRGFNGGTTTKLQHKVERLDTENDEEKICPVGNCRKSFKFLKNLQAHVKDHGNNEEAKRYLEMQSKKVVCQYCRRQFLNVTHLNDHLQVHCGVKPYICIQLNCKASFLSNTELLIHRKEHSVFKTRCIFPNCGKIFNEAFKLYDHEAQHYKTFTCNIPDCGKIFHSQIQLDIHQEEHIINKGESPAPQSSEPGLSLMEQMLSDHTPLTWKNCPESKNQNIESDLLPQSGMMAPSIESLLTSSQSHLQTLERYAVKMELQDRPVMSIDDAQCPDNSMIPSSMNSNCSDMSRLGDSTVPLLEHLEAAPQNRLTPAFDSTGEETINNFPDQHQIYSTNGYAISTMYDSDCNVALPEQLQAMLSNSQLPACPPQNSMPAAVMQHLPPTVTPQLPSVSRAENSTAFPIMPVSIQGERVRHHCALETCTKHYSSYRSVTKHMKAVHPDFYDQWKLAKKNSMLSRAVPQSVSSASNANLVEPAQNLQGIAAPVLGNLGQNVIQPALFGNYANLSSHSLSIQNEDVPMHVERISHSNVLSQLASVENVVTPVQPHAATMNQWPSTSDDILHSVPGSSQVYPSNMQAMSQINSDSRSLTLGSSSCSVVVSNMNRSIDCLNSSLIEDRNQSALPSYMGNAKDVAEIENSLQSFTSQTQSNSISNPMVSDIGKEMQNLFQPNCSSSKMSGSNRTQTIKEMLRNGSESQFRKKNKRTKWPAIIKNGKFFCCRCFREFDNPKSLGGHLSKRSSCKPFDETDLNTDLPTSFLDLLNSEQTHNSLQPQLICNPSAVYQQTPYQSESATSGTLGSKDSHTSSVILPLYGNCESNDDILKQIMADANMADLFEPPAVSQSSFQSQCGSYGGMDCLPVNSVIQHTGNIQVKAERDLCRYPQSSLTSVGSNDFPDSIISHLLSETPPDGTPGNPPIDTLNTGEMTDSGHLSAMTHLTPGFFITNPGKQAMSPDSEYNLQAAHGKLSEMRSKSPQKNIRKKLRQQILSGERRNNYVNTKNIGCISPTSLGSDSQFSPNTQSSQDPKASSTPPEFCGQILGDVNTQSFSGFREVSIAKRDIPSPISIVANDVDLEPIPLSANQQKLMLDIQNSFEKLDLVREAPDQILSSLKQISNDLNNETCESKSNDSITLSPVKPFACDSPDCTFRTISSEALWKHLTKNHKYTLQMVNKVKQKYGKLAQFCCEKCSKAFTRNSNLRIHYQSAHRLSVEEIKDLDTKRREARAIFLSKQSPASSLAMTTITRVQNVNKTMLVRKPMLNPRDGNPSIRIDPLHSNPICNQEVTPTIKAESVPAAVQLPQRGLVLEQQTARQHRPMFAMPAKNISEHEDSDLQTRQSHHAHLSSTPLPASVPQPLNNCATLNNQQLFTPNVEKTSLDVKKTKDKKPESNTAFSPYRPYCCVHEGCAAAFTIQHNLILHYRTVHQSALSVLEVNQEQDQADESEEGEGSDTVIQVSEFACQEKECSRVFKYVPSLLQHYLQLHELSLDKAGTLMSSVTLGRFACDQQGCTASFTAFWKYIDHVKQAHENVKLSKKESVNEVFRCEIEGCGLVYATKSNLLRHRSKKHRDTYKLKLMNQEVTEDGVKQISKNSHYQISKTSNGKENIESNKTISQRASEKKRTDKAKNNHWSNYGKPSLKSKEEAAALCTMKSTLQYPCMIKGCESVMRSEKSIMKHYLSHGLSEKYMEEQRSHFIFCKKMSRKKYRNLRSDDSRSENSSDLSEAEDMVDANIKGNEYEYSKPVLRKRVTAVNPIGMFSDNLSNDESSDTSSDDSIVIKRKRGRPRKFLEKTVKRKRIPRNTKSRVVYHTDDDSEEEVTEQNAPLTSFKPMGFEMSFLKFLEQSNPSQYPLNEKAELVGISRKTSKSCLSAKETCVAFSNRQNYKLLSKVKIVVDGAFSDVKEHLLKQLQDMRPTVVLEKNY